MATIHTYIRRRIWYRCFALSKSFRNHWFRTYLQSHLSSLKGIATQALIWGATIDETRKFLELWFRFHRLKPDFEVIDKKIIPQQYAYTKRFRDERKRRETLRRIDRLKNRSRYKVLVHLFHKDHSTIKDISGVMEKSERAAFYLLKTLVESRLVRKVSHGCYASTEKGSLQVQRWISVEAKYRSMTPLETPSVLPEDAEERALKKLIQNVRARERAQADKQRAEEIDELERMYQEHLEVVNE